MSGTKKTVIAAFSLTAVLGLQACGEEGTQQPEQVNQAADEAAFQEDQQPFETENTGEQFDNTETTGDQFENPESTNTFE